jgi:hypothetical protein
MRSISNSAVLGRRPPRKGVHALEPKAKESLGFVPREGPLPPPDGPHPRPIIRSKLTAPRNAAQQGRPRSQLRCNPSARSRVTILQTATVLGLHTQRMSQCNRSNSRHHSRSRHIHIRCRQCRRTSGTNSCGPRPRQRRNPNTYRYDTTRVPPTGFRVVGPQDAGNEHKEFYQST